jgi:hypothetical protein
VFPVEYCPAVGFGYVYIYTKKHGFVLDVVLTEAIHCALMLSSCAIKHLFDLVEDSKLINKNMVDIFGLPVW